MLKTRLNKFKIVNDNKFLTGLKPSKSYKRPTRLRKSQTRRHLIRLVLNLLSLAVKVIWWLPKVFTLCEVEPKDFDSLLNSLHRIVKIRGVHGFFLYIKDLRGTFLAAVAGELDKRREFRIKSYSDGIPKCFGRSLTDKVRLAILPGGNTAILKIVNTLLFCSRALSIGYKVKTNTITDPPFEGPLRITKYCRSFWKHLGFPGCSKVTVPSNVRFKKYHFSSKGGPEGHALWTSMVDFSNLDENLRKDLETMGGEKLISNFKELDKLLPLLKLIPDFPTEGLGRLRKIVSFPEKEDKVRVVAILDYFSQTVLRPLHLFLFRVLKKIPQDCTFEQESFINQIKDWDYFVSADLTAATDRFPFRLISDVLKGYFPTTYVDAFTRILVERPFLFEGKPLTYRTGNPMGAYASWSSFTIAHHYVVYYCCRELKIPYHTAKYCMLGDDIVIGDKRLATLYIDVMLDLGVSINFSKSHKSLYFCEFAKRLIFRGSDITPFPISSLKETSKRYYSLTNLLMEWDSKGYHSTDGIPATVYSFYELIKPVNSKTRATWRKRSRFCEVITQVMSDIIPTNEAINSLIREFDYRIKELDVYECESILSQIVSEIFSKSDPTSELITRKGFFKMKQPYWLINHLSGVEERIMDWLGYDFSPIPIFSCYMRIGNKFKTLSETADYIYEYGSGYWPKSFLTMEVPQTSSVFYQRTEDKVNVTDSQMAELLIYHLDKLESRFGSRLPR